jgi:hypothetical protein
MTSINVLTNGYGHPCGLNSPQKPVAVRHILDFWRDCGRWWLNEPPRDYYLLELETGNVIEVFRAGDAWTLSRISD